MERGIHSLNNKYLKADSFFNIKNNTSDGIYEAYNMNLQDIVDYSDYKVIQNFLKNSKLQEIGNCSKEMQDVLKILGGVEDAERLFFRKERRNLLDSMRRIRLSGAIKSLNSILYLFFTKRGNHKRIINIGKDVKYDGIDKDTLYLKYIINKIKDPERRSKLAYLLGRIKDKRIKKKFERSGRELTQFDLLLQQCKKGQIMLTNSLNLDGGSSLFKDLTQVVSGSRWCYSLIISDIIRDTCGIVTDLKVIQATLNGGVHEISFKEYVGENYSKSDFLLASFPRKKVDPIILDIKNHIGQKYDRISMMLDILAGGDVNSVNGFYDVDKTYCTGLIFDAMKRANCKVPKSHITPSDILLVKELTLEYACFCNEL